DDRIVTLEGSVQDYHNKVRAADILRHADDKVEGVRNLLAVNTQTVPDEQLKSKLADKLRYDRIDRGIMFNNLTLGVKDGHVTLFGVVDSQMDKQIAEVQAKSVPGAFSVDDKLVVSSREQASARH